MVCYTVPMIAAIAHIIMRRNITSWKESAHHLWLSLLLGGGAVFGLVDHWWNGELFYIGDNIIMDLSLGIAITVTILVIWTIMFTLDKNKSKKPIKA